MQIKSLGRLMTVGLAAFGLFALASASRAQTITFDDLSGTTGAVPNGYNGLNWTAFNYVDPVALGFPINSTGYKNGIVSAPKVAFNNFAQPASFESVDPFTFNSVYLTGAWNDDLTIRIQGFNGANLVHDQSVLVDSTGPTLFNFNWNNLTKVAFASSGGTPHGYSGGGGTHFVMDNLVLNQGGPDIDEVPEPGSLALLLGGALPFGVGLLRRRK